MASTHAPGNTGDLADGLRRANEGAVDDAPTVRADGSRIEQLIADVEVRTAITHIDDRGEMTELFNPDWGFSDLPLTYAYFVTAYPGSVRGWVMHRRQADRLSFMIGSFRVVLWDAREDSPTAGMVNELYFGERRRGHLHIPPGVFHAVQNVGTANGSFTNHPTVPYIHDDPDKARLPLDTELVPYTFAAPRR